MGPSKTHILYAGRRKSDAGQRSALISVVQMRQFLKTLVIKMFGWVANVDQNVGAACRSKLSRRRLRTAR